MFTTESLVKEQFVAEYAGEWISSSEGSRREEMYDVGIGSFFFFFNKYW